MFLFPPLSGPSSAAKAGRSRRPNLAELGRVWSKSGRRVQATWAPMRLESAEFQPFFPKFGQTAADFGPSQQNINLHPQKLHGFRSDYAALVTKRPSPLVAPLGMLAEFCRHRTNSGRKHPTLAESGPNLSQLWPSSTAHVSNVGHIWPGTDEIWPCIVFPHQRWLRVCRPVTGARSNLPPSTLHYIAAGSLK